MHKKVLFILLLIAASSCEDHLISLAKEEIEGTWTVYKYEVDTIDVTPVFTGTYLDYSIEFDRVKNYTENYTLGVTPVTVTGIYLFSDNAKIMTLSDENGSRVFDVVTLNDTALTLQYMDSLPTTVLYLEHL